MDRFSLARFNEVTIAPGDNGNGFIADEVRFGTTWSDVTTVADSSDTDNDGLPDDWEISNGLDEEDPTGDNGALGDPDLDGSSNLEEFTRGTDPQEEDTDGDNIFDGNETDTGIFVSAANTGTDPLDPDSDDDTLPDDVENGSATFVNATNPGTDPNKADTDGDGANDASKIAANTDPTNATQSPSTANSDIVGLDYFDYQSGDFNDKQGGDYFDYDNSTTNDAFVGHIGSQSKWFDSFGDPQIICGQLQTQNAGSYRAFNGASTGGQAISRFGDVPGASTDTIYFRVDLTHRTGVEYAGLSFFENSNELLFFGVLGTDQNLGLQEPGGVAIEFYPEGTQFTRPPATKPSEIQEGKSYHLRAKHSGRLLTASGSNVQQFADQAKRQQDWTFRLLDNGHYHLTSGELALAVMADDNPAVNLQSIDPTNARQQWIPQHIVGTWFHLRNAANGKVLDVAEINYSDGAGIHIWEQVHSPNQIWALELKP